jgi:hypothetical protein
MGLLERWFEEGAARLYCVAWDAATGLRWAQLLADLRATGRAMPVKDSLIAATALTHGLAVATLNLRDFEAADVEAHRSRSRRLTPTLCEPHTKRTWPARHRPSPARIRQAPTGTVRLADVVARTQNPGGITPATTPLAPL